MKPFLGVRGWYLSEYSKHKYWAKDLMLYITSKDTLQKYTDEMSEITGRVDVKSSNPNLKVFEKQYVMLNRCLIFLKCDKFGNRWAMQAYLSQMGTLNKR